MSETVERYTCKTEGCDMSFASEDLLNWHNKKHDIILHLNLENKSNEADQTPTPTRFIRNCEEVGLFQDLQNVNPFEETFKKAVESSKSGTLHVPEASNDDTLHTPHVFPQVEENLNYSSTSSNNEVQTNYFNIESSTQVEASENRSEQDEDRNQKKIVTENNNNSNSSLIHKLKNVIINKEKNVTQTLKIMSESQNCIKRKIQDSIPNNKKPKQDSVIKKRESNRVAQSNCRRRKQMKLTEMEQELQLLKSENKKLSTENQLLKHKISSLKNMLLNHKNCDISTDLTNFNKLEEAISKTIEDANKKKPATTLRPIQPSTAKTKPVLIQILGTENTPKLSLSVSVLPQ